MAYNKSNGDPTLIYHQAGANSIAMLYPNVRTPDNLSLLA